MTYMSRHTLSWGAQHPHEHRTPLGTHYMRYMNMTADKLIDMTAEKLTAEKLIEDGCKVTAEKLRAEKLIDDGCKVTAEKLRAEKLRVRLRS